MRSLNVFKLFIYAVFFKGFRKMINGNRDKKKLGSNPKNAEVVFLYLSYFVTNVKMVSLL